MQSDRTFDNEEQATLAETESNCSSCMTPPQVASGAGHEWRIFIIRQLSQSRRYWKWGYRSCKELQNTLNNLILLRVGFTTTVLALWGRSPSVFDKKIKSFYLHTCHLHTRLVDWFYHTWYKQLAPPVFGGVRHNKAHSKPGLRCEREEFQMSPLFCGNFLHLCVTDTHPI